MGLAAAGRAEEQNVLSGGEEPRWRLHERASCRSPGQSGRRAPPRPSRGEGGDGAHRHPLGPRRSRLSDDERVAKLQGDPEAVWNRMLARTGASGPSQRFRHALNGANAPAATPASARSRRTRATPPPHGKVPGRPWRNSGGSQVTFTRSGSAHGVVTVRWPSAAPANSRRASATSHALSARAPGRTRTPASAPQRFLDRGRGDDPPPAPASAQRRYRLTGLRAIPSSLRSSSSPSPYG